MSGGVRNHLEGKTFGRWLVLERDRQSKAGRLRYHCRCTCGAERSVTAQSLVEGRSTSCGCYSREVRSQVAQTHGRSRTPAYRAWTAMRARCYTPTSHKFQSYGARGITVCDAWRGSFVQFIADMGDPPPGMSLDRIDNDGNYEPGNCRWATREQQQNNRSVNVRISHDGAERTVAEWARIAGVSFRTMSKRIARGWDMARAVSTPSQRTTP